MATAHNPPAAPSRSTATSRRANPSSRTPRSPTSIPLGTRVYHGTSSPTRFQALEGPGWVSRDRRVAVAFVARHPGPRPRILVYEVARRQRLRVFKDGAAIDRFMRSRAVILEEGDDYSVEEIVEEVCGAGYDGWLIPGNYPDGGDDIMLCDPARVLRYVLEEAVDGELERRPNGRARVGHAPAVRFVTSGAMDGFCVEMLRAGTFLGRITVLPVGSLPPDCDRARAALSARHGRDLTAMYVHGVGIAKNERGKGLGAALYGVAAREASRRGAVLVPGTCTGTGVRVSVAARRVWQSRTFRAGVDLAGRWPHVAALHRDPVASERVSGEKANPGTAEASTIRVIVRDEHEFQFSTHAMDGRRTAGSVHVRKALPEELHANCRDAVLGAERLVGRPLRVFVVWGASLLDATYRRRGLGVAMYRAAVTEAARRGGVLVAGACAHMDTSLDARRVWASASFQRGLWVSGLVACDPSTASREVPNFKGPRAMASAGFRTVGRPRGRGVT